MGTGHTIPVSRSTKKVHSWNKDGVCRVEEATRESRSVIVSAHANTSIRQWRFICLFLPIDLISHLKQATK